MHIDHISTVSQGFNYLKKKVVLLFGIVKTAGKLQLNASKTCKYTCTIFQRDILAWSSLKDEKNCCILTWLNSSGRNNLVFSYICIMYALLNTAQGQRHLLKSNT